MTSARRSLVGFLVDARGASACLCSPGSALPGRLSSRWVSAIVQHACQRAGLPVVGAHRLRHTAATEMLGPAGASTEVGQVLRHRSRDVTSIYAKVDRLALSAVVMPWPGAAA